MFSNSMKKAFIIQARVGSTRLPNKMILPFYKDKTVLDILIDNLQRNFSDIPIVLATSTNSENDIIEAKYKNSNCLVFRGSENNVLDRFCEAAEVYSITHIIRVCADNPFLDMKELKNLIEYIENNPEKEYISFEVNNMPSIKTHYGFWTEFVSLEALLKIKTFTEDNLYLEHVTNFIYENKELFNIQFILPNQKIYDAENVRMTLDTLEDFKLLSSIYEILFLKYGKDLYIDQIMEFLSENPMYIQKMNHEIQKNIK